MVQIYQGIKKILGEKSTFSSLNYHLSMNNRRKVKMIIN